MNSELLKSTLVLFRGRHLLPDRKLDRESSLAEMLTGQYRLDQRLMVLRVPEGSALAGHNLAGSRLGAALGFNVMAIIRGQATSLAPGPAAGGRPRGKPGNPAGLETPVTEARTAGGGT